MAAALGSAKSMYGRIDLDKMKPRAREGSSVPAGKLLLFIACKRVACIREAYSNIIRRK